MHTVLTVTELVDKIFGHLPQGGLVIAANICWLWFYVATRQLYRNKPFGYYTLKQLERATAGSKRREWYLNNVQHLVFRGLSSTWYYIPLPELKTLHVKLHLVPRGQENEIILLHCISPRLQSFGIEATTTSPRSYHPSPAVYQKLLENCEFLRVLKTRVLPVRTVIQGYDPLARLIYKAPRLQTVSLQCTNDPKAKWPTSRDQVFTALVNRQLEEVTCDISHFGTFDDYPGVIEWRAVTIRTVSAEDGMKRLIERLPNTKTFKAQIPLPLSGWPMSDQLYAGLQYLRSVKTLILESEYAPPPGELCVAILNMTNLEQVRLVMCYNNCKGSNGSYGLTTKHAEAVVKNRPQLLGLELTGGKSTEFNNEMWFLIGISCRQLEWLVIHRTYVEGGYGELEQVLVALAENACSCLFPQLRHCGATDGVYIFRSCSTLFLKAHFPRLEEVYNAHLPVV